jgi:nucleotide-binding universal stress UspA family protein
MKILVAVDGSENSNHAVQYVGAMLKGAADVKVTLFHVLKALPAELLEHGGSEDPATEVRLGAQLRQDQDAWYKKEREAKCGILTQARDLLAKAGFDTNRVSLKFGHDEDVAQNILEEAREGGYSTVVVGRHGASRIKRFFGGGVTDHVLGQCADLTIWIVE